FHDRHRAAAYDDAITAQFDADQARSRGRLQADEGGPTEAVGPVWGQDGMGAAGDRVLFDAHVRGEDARDEVKRLLRIGGGRDDDDVGGEPGDSGQVRAQFADRTLVGDD